MSTHPNSWHQVKGNKEQLKPFVQTQRLDFFSPHFLVARRPWDRLPAWDGRGWGRSVQSGSRFQRHGAGDDWGCPPCREALPGTAAAPPRSRFLLNGRAQLPRQGEIRLV